MKMAFISNIFHYNNISLLKGTFIDKQQNRKKEKRKNCFIRICWQNTILLKLVDSIFAYAMAFSHNSEITTWVSKNFFFFTCLFCANSAK